MLRGILKKINSNNNKTIKNLIFHNIRKNNTLLKKKFFIGKNLKNKLFNLFFKFFILINEILNEIMIIIVN
jgi:hypothetical protein